MKNGFNFADVLITMIIVGVIFMLTIPALTTNGNDKNLVTELFDFNYKLEDAVNQWKIGIGCARSVKTCLNLQKTLFNISPDFDQLSKSLRVVEKLDEGPSDRYWLPIRTLNYYGAEKSDYDYRSVSNRSRYLLTDGKIISVETNNDGFWLLVDVNGKKLPNRIGKDVFHVIVGYSPTKDINYYSREKTTDGICGPNYSGTPVVCDPDNIDPSVGNGASPAAYTILHHALPDYKALSKSVDGFNP